MREPRDGAGGRARAYARPAATSRASAATAARAHEVEARAQARGRGGRRGERRRRRRSPGGSRWCGARAAPSLGAHPAACTRSAATAMLIDVLLPHGARRAAQGRATSSACSGRRRPLHVPRDCASGRTARPAHRAAGPPSRCAELMERERSQGPEAALAAIECHRCPWGSPRRCEQRLARASSGWSERLAPAARGARRLPRRLLAGVPARGRGARAVRRRAGRQAPRAKGRLIAGLRHDNELLVAEVVDRGVLDDTTLAEAAALCSALHRGVALGRADGRARLPQEAAEAQAQGSSSSATIADTVVPGAARAAPGRCRSACIHGLHAGGVPVGVGRGRLVGHRGGVLRRPRGRPDPRHAPADRRAAPARGGARGAAGDGRRCSARRPA